MTSAVVILVSTPSPLDARPATSSASVSSSSTTSPSRGWAPSKVGAAGSDRIWPTSTRHVVPASAASSSLSALSPPRSPKVWNGSVAADPSHGTSRRRSGCTSSPGA